MTINRKSTRRFTMRQIGAFWALRSDRARLRDRRMSLIVSKRPAVVSLSWKEAWKSINSRDGHGTVPGIWPRDFGVPHSRHFQSRSRNLAGLSRENESRSGVGWGKWVPVRKSRGISVPSPIPGQFNESMPSQSSAIRSQSRKNCELCEIHGRNCFELWECDIYYRFSSSY